jgi:Raf kinase inhibitor-like YbhB/YbcL family protein
MKKFIILIGAIFFSSTLFAQGFTINSNDISGQLSTNQVFNGFGCTGKNMSPKLSWENAPKGTKSFAITIYDPDAPTGSGWWHWVVFDIPKNINSLIQNASELGTLPKGSIEGTTDYGTSGFGGACPPKGDNAHQYIMTVYALDTEKLGLDKNASPALVGYMLNVHTIGKSSVVGYYKR